MNKYLQMPWMFTVVVLGMIFSALGWFQETMAGPTFQFLAKMGMLFFLFTIGVDLELDQIRKLGGYIALGDLLLTLVEGLAIGLFLYFCFPDFVSRSFIVAFLSGIAFGTVGEVVLLAILKEFGLEKTQFGQLALGIGVFDDIFEILALAVIIVLPAFTSGETTQGVAWQESFAIVGSLVAIIAATALLFWVGKVTRRWLVKSPVDLFTIPFIIFMVIFAFIYFGSRAFENMGAIAAIFSGVAVNQLLPEKYLQQYKKTVFFVGNIFLGPFFFLSLGGRMSVNALTAYPLVILALIVLSLSSRIAISYALFHRLLGKRQSVVMGIGLTAKFSTSVISENLLFTSGLITQALFSTIMAAYILLKPIIVGVFARSLAAIKNSIS